MEVDIYTRGVLYLRHILPELLHRDGLPRGCQVVVRGGASLHSETTKSRSGVFRSGERNPLSRSGPSVQGLQDLSGDLSVLFYFDAFVW